MFQAIKRLTGQTLIYGLGHVLTRLVGFILLPVFTHHLPPDQFGVQHLYYLFIAVMMEVFRLGQDIALLRYYALEKGKHQAKVIFSTIFWGMLLFSTAMAGAIWLWDDFWVRLFLGTGGQTDPWMLYTLHVCAAIIWLDNMSAFPLVVMRVENKPGQFQLAKLTGVFLQVGLTILFLVYLGRGVPGIFEANAISAAVTLLICLPLTIRRLTPAFNWLMLSSCLAFGLPNLPNALFVQVIELADRRILTALRSAAEQGIYSAGYKLGLFLSIVAMGFRYAWQPFFMQISRQPDARQIYARVLTYFMALTFWLYLMLTAFVEPLATWTIPGIDRALIAPEYWAGLKVFPIVLLAQVFNGAFAVFMVGIYLEKKMHAIPFITGIAAAINVGLNLTFVPQYGMWASAWATVAAYASMTLLLYVYINRIYPIPWEWRRIGHLIGIGIFVYLIGEIGRWNEIHWIGYILTVLYPLQLLLSGFATTGELERIGLRKKTDIDNE